ncbi:MAG TPA: 16S rRNA (uracil(1498)-N(3))-methyltransferase [Actinoplanes sp.]|nr:16S rRNA (uracil(1498)-N(3))-methyltransferase [Actinoplanes sp.]
MSAPLFLVDQLPSADVVTLDGPEGHHAATVQRIRPGARLILSDGRGGVARGEVTATGRGTVDIHVTGRDFRPKPDPALVVAQGIAKGDRGELAVQAMTEAGADEFIPWAAARSIAQWRGDRGHRSRQKWISTAREAAKQSRRPWLPTVAGDPDCSTAQVAERVSRAAAAYLLHEEAGERLTTAPLPTTGEIILIIGPEGGITDQEIVTLGKATPVRLGPEVLRTSTAGVAALAVLATRLHRW